MERGWGCWMFRMECLPHPRGKCRAEQRSSLERKAICRSKPWFEILRSFKSLAGFSMGEVKRSRAESIRVIIVLFNELSNDYMNYTKEWKGDYIRGEERD